jgi:hypothetical protein
VARDIIRIAHLKNLIYSDSRASIYHKYIKQKMGVYTKAAINTSLERALLRVENIETKIKSELKEVDMQEFVEDLEKKSKEAFESSTDPNLNIFSKIKQININLNRKNLQTSQKEINQLENDLKKEYSRLEISVKKTIDSFNSIKYVNSAHLNNLLANLKEVIQSGGQSLTKKYRTLSFQYGFYNENKTYLIISEILKSPPTKNISIELVGPKAEKADILFSRGGKELFGMSIKAQSTLEELQKTNFSRLKLGALSEAIERIANKELKTQIELNLHQYKMLSFLYRGLRYETGYEEQKQNILDVLNSFVGYFASKAITTALGVDETPPVILFQLSGTYVFSSDIIKKLVNGELSAYVTRRKGTGTKDNDRYVLPFSPKVSSIKNIYTKDLKDNHLGTRSDFFEKYINTYQFTIPQIYISK